MPLALYLINAFLEKDLRLVHLFQLTVFFSWFSSFVNCISLFLKTISYQY
jgi:hypothetical protein